MQKLDERFGADFSAAGTIATGKPSMEATEENSQPIVDNTKNRLEELMAKSMGSTAAMEEKMKSFAAMRAENDKLLAKIREDGATTNKKEGDKDDVPAKISWKKSDSTSGKSLAASAANNKPTPKKEEASVASKLAEIDAMIEKTTEADAYDDDFEEA